MPRYDTVVSEPAPAFAIDTTDPVRSAVGRDPEIYAAARAALVALNEETALIRPLRSFFTVRDTIDKLAARGYHLTDEQKAPFGDSTATEAAKADVEQLLGRQMRARADAAIGPHVARVLRDTLSELKSDLAILATAEAVNVKYAAPTSPIKTALQNAIAQLTADSSKPFTTEWHYSPLIALNQYIFPEQKPLVLDEPAAPVQPSYVAGPAKARTAADVAAARAA